MALTKNTQDNTITNPPNIFGSCDNDKCNQKIFSGDKIIKNTKYEKTIFNLHYCTEKCKKETL